jgi:beta-phosphoglucomutase
MTEAMPKNGPNPGHTARRPVHSFEAAIFDLDGVLVDTAKYHFSAWRQIATEYGFELTEDIAESIKGVGRRAALDLVLRSGRITLPEAEARQIANKKNDYYNNYIRSIDSSDLLPGALNALNKLRRNGVRIALASASRNARTVLDRTGITGLFDAIVDGTNVISPKPSPDVFLEASRSLHVLPHNAVVFEDAAAGVEGSRLAGCFTVGIGDPVILGAADISVPDLITVPWSQLFDESSTSTSSDI